VSALLEQMVHYKAWANEVLYDNVARVPEEELVRERRTHFKTMGFTLNHVLVVDRIFQAHLTGTRHPYTARNTPTHPPLAELREAVRATDRWYLDYVRGLSEARWAERVRFEFVDGGAGEMSRQEIVLHLVNHGSYHRGFVGDMLNQCGLSARSSDLSVFLRDAWPALQAQGAGVAGVGGAAGAAAS
jgi:uncharacterized damage-inducible protein DinB